MKHKTISSLIQRELVLHFLSPSTYLACLFFLISVSVFFLYINAFFVTDLGSTDLRFFFECIPICSILVIPALTMGAWTKEDRHNTLPVSTSSLVIAKWVASLCIFLLFFVASLAIIIIVSLFGSIEIPIIISSIIGIVAYSASVSAFAQLCTIVIKSKVASFFVSALFLSLFTFNGFIANDRYVQNDILASFITFFSFSWNFEPFSKGIIDTRSAFFFLISTVMFLVGSIFLIEYKKYGVHFYTKKKKFIYALHISIFIFLCTVLLNTQVFYTRFDITETKRFSLSEYSTALINTITTPLSISYYVSSELESLYPQIRDVEDFLYEYAKESRNILVEVIEPNSDTIKSSLQSLGITAQNIQSISENTASIVQVYSAIVFEHGNNVEVIPFVLDTSVLEFDIAGRIQSLTHNLLRSAFILVGNDLSLQEDYPFVVPILENSGYSVRELDLDELIHISNLDTHSPLIILGSSMLTHEHAQAIDLFMQIGGKVFISTSPIDINLDTWSAHYSANTDDALLDMLQNYGIVVHSALLQDMSNLDTQLLSQNGTTVQISYPFFIDVAISQANNDLVLGQSFRGLSLLWPSPITISQNNRVIAQTSANSWLQDPNTVLQDQTGEAFITNPFFEQNNHSQMNIQNDYTVAIAHSNSMVLVSDQYFLSRALSYINQEYILRNFDFLINSLLFLQQNEELITLKSKSYVDYSLHSITDESEFKKTQNYAIGFLCVWYVIITLLPYSIMRLLRKNAINAYTKKVRGYEKK